MQATTPLLGGLYELQERLGAGGGGEVFKAWHTRLQKPVVIKRIKSEVRGRIDERGEANILKNLKHTYLPQVYDFFTEGDEVYTVVDFIPGKDFKQFLDSEASFSQIEVIKWGTQLCQALAYLHGQNPPILHGDIKPANVMLTPTGDICLIDFNISLALEGPNAVAIGLSPGYSSPEQYRPVENSFTFPQNEAGNTFTDVEQTGFTETIQTGITEEEPAGVRVNVVQGARQTQRGTVIDERSDIYSLGATLYHMLTGEKPGFSNDGVKPLDSFSKPFGNALTFIIQKAMEPHSRNRFQSATAMLDAFESIHTLDRRWVKMNIQRNIVVIAIVILAITSCMSVVLGAKTLQQERVMKYNSLVLEGSHAQQDGDIERALLNAELASDIFPGQADAYAVGALSLFEKCRKEGDFSECIRYIEQSLANISDEGQRLDKIGDIYFILANSYFEQEEYISAVECYKTAVSYNQSNPEYYRDYAISLARTQRIDEADKQLETARKLGLGTDALMLISGEVAYARGEYAEAAHYFEEAIRLTQNDYIKLRAYRIGAMAYRSLGDSESLRKEIALLEKGKTELQGSSDITEALAGAYISLSNSGAADSHELVSKAIACFEELLAKGNNRFHIWNNLAILYHQSGEMQRSEELLHQMEAKFPDEYRVYQRLAFLYADMQFELPNEQRDYSLFLEAYLKAQELYEARMENSKTDTEMLMLYDLYDEIEAGNWFD